MSNITNNIPTTNEDWNFLTSFLPANWQDLAKEKNAVAKRLFAFKSIDSMLRGLLLHIGKGYSLRETSARLKTANIANISDVGILKALRRSEGWLQELCYKLYFEQGGVALPNNNIKKNMRLIDGSIVSESGKTGSQWRINYSLSLPNLECDYFDLTSSKGKGNGESLVRYPVNPGDCLIADRGYSRVKDILYTKSMGADVIVRVNQQILPLYQEDGSRFKLLENLKTLDKTGETAEWTVIVKNDEGELVKGRICAIRKNSEAIKLAQKKATRKSSINNRIMKPDTLEYAKYITIFTTLSEDEYSTKEILDWYRVRWQIELAFKRLKSIAGLGHLPKYDPQSSRAWLYGKLLIGLLAEKIIRYSKTISPWGYHLPT